MPVLSPHRGSASSLTGSYRPSFSSSALDRPYFGSSSYNPRISSYSERITTRAYTDSDGRRIYSRSGSITEDGVTTRFREESREGSLSRDSGIGSIRESSVCDYPRRDSSTHRDRDNSRVSALSVLDSVAELRNKYSPANYVPACLRNKNDNIARSKSINDIGLPPVIESKYGKKKVTSDGLNLNNAVAVLNSNNHTNNDNGAVEDDNGNRASVSDLRKKFDEKVYTKSRTGSIIDKHKVGDDDGKKSGDAKLRKRDNFDLKKTNGVNGENSIDVQLNGGKIEENGVAARNGSRINHFASYIPSKDYQKGEESTNGTATVEIDEEPTLKKSTKDISSTSPKSTSKSPSGGAVGGAAAAGSTSPLSTSRDNHHRDRSAHILETSPVKVLGLNGLKNIGNTCFMNSVIQCLSNTKLLLEYLKKDGYTTDINTTTSGMKGALIKAFAEVIKELWSSDASDRVVNTVSLKSQIQRFAPRFIGYSQQDAQEFLRYLLEGLHEDVNRVKEKPKPIVTEIDEKLSDADKAAESWSRYLRMDNSKIVDCFVGQLKSTLKCTHCGHCSVTFDPFWDLSLPIPQRTGQLRLSQCLDSFTREETLDGDEKPTCSKCKERRKCTKSFTIQKFPKILVIHLKRFSPTERFRGKLNVTVDFPLEGLDMSQYSADNVSTSRYNLYAISNHSGTTYSGHYTAYCRHPYAHTWHEYNDSRVSSISPKSIVSGEAYVLFYEQEGQKSHL